MSRSRVQPLAGLWLLSLAACSSSSAIPLDRGGVLPLGTDHPGTKRLAVSPPEAPFTRPTRPHGGWAILKAEAGPGLVHTCDGDLIEGVTSYWIPTLAQVEEVETGLAAALGQEVDGYGDHAGGTVDAYYRQYLGVVARGQSLILLHGMNAEIMEDLAPRQVRGGERFDWKRDSGSACGGGGLFFHAAYDPGAHRFVAFRFNSPI
ncbi:MAG: hypothetical protein ABJE95_23785 [Byssovorax sp.]